MTYEPLHHKYRPQTFAELVGQEAIATTLTNALRQQKIAPAYLFTGARGTGKTSSARIFAKSLNCQKSEAPTEKPCGVCEVCRAIANGSALDVIEIDAASNTGVDNIRELIERSQFAPVQCRYKVYVIDECLTGDSLVLTDRGLMRIDDPTIKYCHVLSYNDLTQQWEWKKVLRWIDQGKRKTFEIQTSHRKIRCTGNHLIRTEKGWVAAQEIVAGMKILSPVPVDAKHSSTKLEPTVENVVLQEGISSKAIPLKGKTIPLRPFSKQQNHYVQTVPADVVSDWKFPLFFNKKAKELPVSKAIGNGILTSKIMGFGTPEPGTLQRKQEKLLKTNSVLFSEPCWEIVRSPIPTVTAASPGCIGQMENPNEPGQNTKPSAWQGYILNSALHLTRDTENNQAVAARFAIQDCRKSIQLFDRMESTSKSVSQQWNTNLETVVSVIPVGIENVYDIEVEDNHNFVANGLLVHNCHMLSTAAFNALLKTLEEPPPHVVFVLATTDPQRVLPTIISRCQRFDFRRIPLEEMTAHLTKIADKEAIAISPDALQLVAQISQGGLRDAESLLDQLSLLEGKISVEKVWNLVGAVPERDLLEVLRAIASDSPEDLLDQVRHLMDRGREPLIVLQNLGSFYRDLLIAKTAPQRNDLVSITPPTWKAVCEFVQSFEIGWILEGQRHLRTAEVQIRNTTQPRLWLEVTLMGLLPSAIYAASPEGTTNQATISPPIRPPVPKPLPTPPAPSPITDQKPEPQITSDEVAEDSSPGTFSSAEPHQAAEPSIPTEISALQPAAFAASTSSVENLAQIWQNVLNLVQPNSTQILLRQQCRLLGFDGQVARVAVAAQPLLGMAKSKLTNIEAAFARYANQPIRVNLEVSAPTGPEVASTTVLSTPAPQSPTPEPPKAQQNGMRSPVPQVPAVQPPVAQSPADPPPPIAPQPPSPPAIAPEPQRTSASEIPPPVTPPSPLPVTPLPLEQPAWEEEDEVLRAARSLAQMFSGQIVKLDADRQLSSDGTLPADPSQMPEDTDDDDVPF